LRQPRSDPTTRHPITQALAASLLTTISLAVAS
jgi:hypothetical protein